VIISRKVRWAEHVTCVGHLHTKFGRNLNKIIPPPPMAQQPLEGHALIIQRFTITFI